jgi:hypothetical protein
LFRATRSHYWRGWDEYAKKRRPEAVKSLRRSLRWVRRIGRIVVSSLTWSHDPAQGDWTLAASTRRRSKMRCDWFSIRKTTLLRIGRRSGKNVSISIPARQKFPRVFGMVSNDPRRLTERPPYRDRRIRCRGDVGWRVPASPTKKKPRAARLIERAVKNGRPTSRAAGHRTRPSAVRHDGRNPPPAMGLEPRGHAALAAFSDRRRPSGRRRSAPDNAPAGRARSEVAKDY